MWFGKQIEAFRERTDAGGVKVAPDLTSGGRVLSAKAKSLKDGGVAAGSRGCWCDESEWSTEDLRKSLGLSSAGPPNDQSFASRLERHSQEQAQV